MSFLAQGASPQVCTICLNTISNDNSRGKAELICGHLFHLDCIGSEFNYKQGDMICPNCRVIEYGEWRLAENEDCNPEDSNPLSDVQHMEFHVYSDHAMSNRASTSSAMNGSQRSHNSNVALQVINGQDVTHGSQSTAIVPTNLYHHSPFIPSPTEFQFIETHNSFPIPGTRVEHRVVEDRPVMSYVSQSYESSTYVQSNSSSPVVQAPMLRRRRDSSARMAISRRTEASSSYQFNSVQEEQLTNVIEVEDREIVELDLISQLD